MISSTQILTLIASIQPHKKHYLIKNIFFPERDSAVIHGQHKTLVPRGHTRIYTFTSMGMHINLHAYTFVCVYKSRYIFLNYCLKQNICFSCVSFFLHLIYIHPTI